MNRRSSNQIARLEGKTAIVTGGGSGIGRATAECFAKEGAAVVITGRTASRLEETKARIDAAGGKCEAVPGDVGKVESHDAAIGAHFNDGPFFPYDTSKAGLLGLSRCMAVRLAQYGIRSNVVSPGATKTDLMTGLTGAKMDDYMENNFERVPIRRILASDESSGVTGTELIVDGGLTADAYVIQSLPDFGEGPPKPFFADVGS